MRCPCSPHSDHPHSPSAPRGDAEPTGRRGSATETVQVLGTDDRLPMNPTSGNRPRPRCKGKNYLALPKQPGRRSTPIWISLWLRGEWAQGPSCTTPHLLPIHPPWPDRDRGPTDKTSGVCAATALNLAQKRACRRVIFQAGIQSSSGSDPIK